MPPAARDRGFVLPAMIVDLVRAARCRRECGCFRAGCSRGRRSARTSSGGSFAAGRLQAVVFVEVERDHVREIEPFLAVHADQLAIDAHAACSRSAGRARPAGRRHCRSRMMPATVWATYAGQIAIRVEDVAGNLQCRGTRRAAEVPVYESEIAINRKSTKERNGWEKGPGQHHGSSNYIRAKGVAAVWQCGADRPIGGGHRRRAWRRDNRAIRVQNTSNQVVLNMKSIAEIVIVIILAGSPLVRARKSSVSIRGRHPARRNGRRKRRTYFSPIIHTQVVTNVSQPTLTRFAPAPGPPMARQSSSVRAAASTSFRSTAKGSTSPSGSMPRA